MLALPVYRAMSRAAVAHTRVGPFTVRETTQVTPPKPRLLDRVREAIRARQLNVIRRIIRAQRGKILGLWLEHCG